jgi:CheY-like chemotaxis protein
MLLSLSYSKVTRIYVDSRNSFEPLYLHSQKALTGLADRSIWMPEQDTKPSKSRPIEILLVDDHPHVRKLAREIIETYPDLRIVGEAGNGEEAVLLAVKLKPAVVVMDIHLPVLGGIPATTLIKLNNPFTVVIGLTAGDPQQDEKAMAIAGASAVIDKGQIVDALHRSIISALERLKNPAIA